MTDIPTAANDGGEKFFDESPAFDGERNRRPRDVETTNNLTLYRWRTPIPEDSELAELIRLAKAGDPQAGRRLVECFHRFVLKLVTRFYGPSLDDLIAAGMLGFWQAVCRYNPRRNAGLRAYAEKIIEKFMRAEVSQWRRRGQAGATRADCALFDRPSLNSPEEIVADLTAKGMGLKDPIKSLREADLALARQAGYWNGHEPYDTREPGVEGPSRPQA